MNNLVVPPSPNWYISDILACTPDNTLIYGSKNDIIVVSQTSDGRPLHVQNLDRAHNQKVVYVDANKQWGCPNKWVVSSGEDGHVKLWDIQKLCKISSHEAHKQDQKDKLIGARFLTEDRILSVSENGNMYIWHPSNKEYTKMANFFQMKVNISCFSPCPHATFITAFGLKNGLIVVANLKKNGTLLHKLRGHTNEIVSLSWCPAPINIFPSNPNNYIKGTTPPEKFNVTLPSDANVDEHQPSEDQNIITDALADATKTSNDNTVESGGNNENPQNIEEIQEKPSVKQNPWINLHFDDDDDEGKIEDKNRTMFTEIPDFLEECDLLKKKIESLSLEVSETDSACTDEKVQTEHKKDVHVENESVNDESQIAIPDFLEECDLLKEKIESLSLEVSEKDSPCIDETLETEQKKDEHVMSESVIDESQIDTSNQNISLECKNENSDHKSSDDTIQSSCRSDEDTKLEKTNGSPSKLSSRNCVAEDPRKEYLLASSGKDSTINIWRAGTDGRLQCFFKLPEQKYKKSNNKDKKNVIWTVVRWVSPFTLLTATKKGVLLKYCLPRPVDPKKQFSIVHNDHTSTIFAMGAHIPTFTAENWLDKIDTNFWTFGHDMYLLNTDLNSQKHLTTLETFCALIQCSSQSPVDPSRICFGLSNGTIKIWNMNERDIRNFSTKNYSPKIYSKILSLAWHPTDEMLLAFSTEEGTIGFFNTSNKQKVTWFKQTFSNKVHKIEWGPRNENDGKMGLYATGNGQLKCFNPDDPKSDAVSINLFSDTVAYTFAWKLDYSLMILSATNGKLIVFNPDFSIKATYYEKKKINILSWHPDSAISSEENMPKSNLVAAVLDSVVYIYDFAELSTKDGVLDIENVPKILLDGHISNIRCLAWSPFDGNRLVTAGEGGLAHVWNISTQEILATFYRQSFEPIKTILWSSVHEDVLLCSTTNASLIMWKMSDYPAPLSEEIMVKLEQHVKNEKKKYAINDEDPNQKIVKKVKKTIKNTILPNLNVGPHDDTQKQVKILQELLEWKETGSMLTNGVPNIKQLFGTREDVLKLLNGNELSHIEKGKYDAANMVSFWKGDLQSSIIDAIDQRRVTPLLISLAPSVSQSVWQKACETYAKQLEERDDSDPLEIATYYMACQNIEKAISSLCDREMFKEALVLAKCRLPENNVFIEEVLQKWASFSTYHGSLETAAQCYIALGKFEDTAKVLFRRSESEILNFALDLAKKTQNDELTKAIEFRCKAFSQVESADDKTECTLAIPNTDDKVNKIDETLVENFEVLKPIEEGMNSCDEERKISDMEPGIEVVVATD